jgi:hypothetical protein
VLKVPVFENSQKCPVLYSNGKKVIGEKMKNMVTVESRTLFRT